MPPALDAYLFRPAPSTTDPVPGLRIRLRQAAEKDLDVTVPLAGPWSATVDAQARFEGGLELELHPDGQVHIEPPVAAGQRVLSRSACKAAHADGSPMILIGQVGGSRLELKTFSARLPLQLSASTGAPVAAGDAWARRSTLDQGKLVIDTSNADGFIAQLLSRGQGRVRLRPVRRSTTPHQGLRFTGSATIEIAIPTHLTLGPVSIPDLYLIGGFKDGTVPVEFSADLGANLGPARRHRQPARRAGDHHASRRAAATPAPRRSTSAFKPPNGVGLSVDAGVVKGGGFLYHRHRARASTPARSS